MKASSLVLVRWTSGTLHMPHIFEVVLIFSRFSFHRPWVSAASHEPLGPFNAFPIQECSPSFRVYVTRILFVLLTGVAHDIHDGHLYPSLSSLMWPSSCFLPVICACIYFWRFPSVKYSHSGSLTFCHLLCFSAPFSATRVFASSFLVLNGWSLGYLMRFTYQLTCWILSYFFFACPGCYFFPWPAFSLLFLSEPRSIQLAFSFQFPIFAFFFFYSATLVLTDLLHFYYSILNRSESPNAHATVYSIYFLEYLLTTMLPTSLSIPWRYRCLDQYAKFLPASRNSTPWLLSAHISSNPHVPKLALGNLPRLQMTCPSVSDRRHDGK